MAITTLLLRNEVEGFLKARMVAEHTVAPYIDNGFDKMGDYVLVKWAEGRVVNTREANGYHDSDFFATYLTDEGTFSEYQYATTRGWTYANNANIDATDDVAADYQKMLEFRAESRRQAVEKLKDKDAADCNITREQYDRLCRIYSDSASRNAVLKLLSSKLRSSFRIQLANQVRAWLENENPKYDTPLSAKQLQYV